MTIDRDSEESYLIRQLIPLSRVPESKFTALCKELSVDQAKSGSFLFRQGDTKNDLIYLLNGRINLQTDEFKVETIDSGTESARFAIAHQIPRKIDAIAESDIRFVRLNAEIIHDLQNTSIEEESSYMIVNEPEENDNDWMTTLLKSPIFRALPPANLQRIIMELQAVNYTKGEFIIRQGEPGDFYYLIKSGQCLITRKPSANAKDIKLGQLRSQDTFGEDSLLSGEPRNVSVIALSDVSLLQLNKESFIKLIKTPSLKYVSFQQAQNEIAKGALLMDVRSPDEYQSSHLKNSTNIPFFSLRMHLKTLNKKQPVIVACNDGKTSEAAAFLLLRNKISASILEGGIKQCPEQAHSDKASFTIDDGIDASAAVPATVTTPVQTEKPHAEKPSETETHQLKQRIVKLEEKCRILTTEKEELSKKYKILFKQTEKLKEVLDSLKKNKR